jgi:hypothetical protein
MLTCAKQKPPKKGVRKPKVTLKYTDAIREMCKRCCGILDSNVLTDVYECKTEVDDPCPLWHVRPQRKE